MNIGTGIRTGTGTGTGSAPRLGLLVAAGLLALSPAAALAGPCTSTADYMLQACKAGVQDDTHVAAANCINESDIADRAECYEDRESARAEALEECNAQRVARIEVCGLMGEARYDPDFDQQDFQSRFTDPVVINPYLPIKVGNKWRYAGGGEEIRIEVLNRTKLIDDVTCAVVRDTVKIGGVLAEDTYDWFAQKDNGDVWYCGEETAEYEVFKGDRPRLPELVSIEGAFKVDRDGAKAGIVFLGAPTVGAAYRQEFHLGNAEDVVEVLSTTYRYGDVPEFDRLVPKALAQLLCSHGDCVVTRDFTPLSPGSNERKYYARGIGVFLETNVDEGERIQIVACNMDSRCAMLPGP